MNTWKKLTSLLLLIFIFVLASGSSVLASTASYVCPVRNARVSQSFAAVFGGQTHLGVDLSSSGDDTIVAARDGRVLYASNGEGDKTRGNGLHIVIDHEDGSYSSYSHLSRISVRTGDRAYANNPIGVMGSTGKSTGKHLHFSIFNGASSIDPAGYSPIRYDRSVTQIIYGGRTFFNPLSLFGGGPSPIAAHTYSVKEYNLNYLANTATLTLTTGTVLYGQKLPDASNGYSFQLPGKTWITVPPEFSITADPKTTIESGNARIVSEAGNSFARADTGAKLAPTSWVIFWREP